MFQITTKSISPIESEPSYDDELGLTFVMVTHDQEEALSISCRIAVMNSGRIEQIGTPAEIYEKPRTPFVANFIGNTSLFHGKVNGVGAEVLSIITDRGVNIRAQAPDEPLHHAKAVVSVRPEKVRLGSAPDSDRENCFTGILRNILYLGTHIQCIVNLVTGDQVTVLEPSPLKDSIHSGSTVYVSWDSCDGLTLRLPAASP